MNWERIILTKTGVHHKKGSVFYVREMAGANPDANASYTSQGMFQEFYFLRRSDELCTKFSPIKSRNALQFQKILTIVRGKSKGYGCSLVKKYLTKVEYNKHMGFLDAIKFPKLLFPIKM